MPVVSEKMKREDLFQRILDTLREWPNLDQQIFVQAHYQGQSIETISRFINLDVREVRLILQYRDRELYASLRKFREGNRRKQPLTSAQSAIPTTCRLVFAGCSI